MELWVCGCNAGTERRARTETVYIERLIKSEWSCESFNTSHFSLFSSPEDSALIP